MNPNINPETGIRYGVVAVNNLDPALVQELWYGPDARDLSYEKAIVDLEVKFGAEWDSAMEDAEIAASEVDAHMGDEERTKFIEQHMADAGFRWGFQDHATDLTREEWVEAQIESEAEFLEIDEPVIKGELEGVKYLLTWLGGAPLLTVLEGPVGYAARLCSPCVPNAADLDSGYSDVEDSEFVHECYIVPLSWKGEIK